MDPDQTYRFLQKTFIVINKFKKVLNNNALRQTFFKSLKIIFIIANFLSLIRIFIGGVKVWDPDPSYFNSV